MLRIGLTGNIGSGKTLISKVFQIIGIPVFSADLEGRRLLNEPAIISSLIHRWGKEVINSQGVPDRQAIARLVFSDREALQWLNDLIHPQVWASFEEWVQKQHSRYCIHEAAIIYEHGFQDRFDAMILVTAPLELRMQRVMRRDGITSVDFNQRAEKQWPDEKLQALADYIIWNDETHAVLPQVFEIHEKLLSIGPAA